MLKEKCDAYIEMPLRPKVSGRKQLRRRAVKPQFVAHPVCGRTIEVLQAVDLRSFPLFMLGSWTFNVSVDKDQSDLLLEIMHNAEQSLGLLARLRIYSDRGAIPCCANTNSLNTEAWKNSVLANEIREPPEKDVDDNVIYLFFLLLPQSAKNLSSSCLFVARDILSPREINRQIIHSLNLEGHTDRDLKQMPAWATDSSCNLHIIDEEEAFRNILKLLKSHQENTAREIHDRTIGLEDSESEQVKTEILQVASEVQGKIMTMAFQGYPTLAEYLQQQSGQHRHSSLWTPASFDDKTFPEKVALQAKAAKRMRLQSYTSSDHLPCASPLPAEEMEKKKGTSGFDIKDVLQMFDKEGRPLSPPFTPEKLEGCNLCRIDSTSDLSTPWPNSQSIQFHDIHYYMDENDLTLERKYSNIRDKLFGHDTISSFVSPVKKRSQPLRRVSPIRSSPRRRNSAKNLMTRTRSESNQSTSSPVPVLGGREIFKQPSASLSSPSTRRLSLPHQGHTGSSGRGLGSASRARNEWSTTQKTNRDLGENPKRQPMSHSTPKGIQPVRASPRKLAMSRFYSSTAMQSTKTLYGSEDSGKLHALHRSSSTASPSFHDSSLSSAGASQHSRLSRSVSNIDPPVRRSPRKLSQASSDGCKMRRQNQSRSQSISQGSGCTSMNTSSSFVDHDESSCQSVGETTKMKRSDRHKLKLKGIISNVLQEKGVTESDVIYTACSKNLFDVSMVLLRTLTTSQNLTEEMKNVVYGQVSQIVNLEKRRCGISL